MSEEFLYPEFETKWSNSEIIDMLFDWAKFCMKNKTGDLSNDTAEYFSDKLKAKIAVCSPITPPTTEEAELWNDFMLEVHSLNSFEENDLEHIIKILRENYRLSRRSEQNTEAIEFAEWASTMGCVFKKEHKIWAREGFLVNKYSSAELYQEFQLFKKQKQ